uniref:Homeobox domain-containing protein n=1 Tax=Oryzias latipes TaxID=8090 RepID=A0A3P9IMN7_ORYLA
MDPQQPAALPLQLHGNRFATSSGQLPKLSAGPRERGGGGGGRGQHWEQQKMTSSAPVSSRLNPHGQSECLLEPGVHCHAKGKLDSKRVLAIWHSGVIFPWMTLRTTYSKASVSVEPSSSGAAVKRERTAFTNSQLLELEKEFHFSPYLCRRRRLEMAAGLQLTDQQVKIWFQNRRMRHKNKNKERKNFSQGTSCNLNSNSDPHALEFTVSPLFGDNSTTGCIHPGDMSHRNCMFPSLANGSQLSSMSVGGHHYPGVSSWS